MRMVACEGGRQRRRIAPFMQIQQEQGWGLKSLLHSEGSGVIFTYFIQAKCKEPVLVALKELDKKKKKE